MYYNQELGLCIEFGPVRVDSVRRGGGGPPPWIKSPLRRFTPSWTSTRVTCDCLLPFVHPLLSQVISGCAARSESRLHLLSNTSTSTDPPPRHLSETLGRLQKPSARDEPSSSPGLFPPRCPRRAGTPAMPLRALRASLRRRWKRCGRCTRR